MASLLGDHPSLPPSSCHPVLSQARLFSVEGLSLGEKQDRGIMARAVFGLIRLVNYLSGPKRN